MDALTDAIRSTVAGAVRDALQDERRPIAREALTIRETAEALGRSTDWVRAQIAADEIPARRVDGTTAVLIPVHQLRAWLEGER